MQVRGSSGLAAGAGVVSLILALASAGCRADSDDLIVLAAASLSGTFDELAGAFESSEGGRTACSYAGSQILATQVASGVAADLIATADRASLRGLIDSGRIEPPIPFAHNRLVWIVRPELHGPPLGPNTDVRRLVLAAPEVPVGRYARVALRQLGALERAKAEEVSLEADVKGVVAKVLFGVADAGIVYATDVTPSIADRVRVVELPREAQVMVTYEIALIVDAPHADRARRFIHWLESRPAQSLLERRGFSHP